MNINNKYLLFGFCISSIFSIGLIVAYHYWSSSSGHFYGESIRRATEVAESQIQFSSKFNESYRSSVPSDFIRSASLSRKSVVYIKSRDTNFNGNSINESINQAGSGVILSSDGFIVTNDHVVKNAKNIEVLLNDNRVYNGRLVGKDPNTDLALIKIEANDLDYLTFGNSDSLQIGEWVLAVGNPFKLQSTVTAGIVSAKGRNINLLENQGIESFIQTDAAINPGNSGGALVNTNGDLVGICTAVLSNSGRYEGFSFAIPSNLVKKVVSDLKEFGVVQRAWLGVEMENVNSSIASKLNLKSVTGIYLASVFKDGAAYDSGLKVGDVIISINDIKTSSIGEFTEQLARYRPGNIISLSVIRSNVLKTINSTLKNQLNTTDLVGVRNDLILNELGFEIRELDSYEKSMISGKGVLVVSIQNGSIIHKSRMEPGYIIKSINGKPIDSAKDMADFFENNRGKPILLEGLYLNYPGEFPYTFIIPF